MEQKRLRQKYLKCILFLLFFLGSAFGGNSVAGAYSASEIATLDDLGSYSSEPYGYSHEGVAIYWDDQLICYAIDTEQNQTSDTSSSNWVYLATNYNGAIYNITSDFEPASSPISVYKTGWRFHVDLDMLRNGRMEYSVLLKTSSTSAQNNYFEIADIPSGTYGTYCASSLSSQTTESSVWCSTLNHNSYVFKFYTVQNIDAGEEIAANAGGGSVESPGKAYYNGSGYILTKLPTASYVKAGYTTTFKGWYTAASGGTQYQLGTVLKKGTTLYAQWTVTPKQYTVTCVDVLGKDASGTELGRSSWSADCDATVTGATAGSDQTVGKYYAHCAYTGASTAKVTVSGATVYRYFSYEKFSVQYVDQIESGARKGEVLGTSTLEKEYSSTASGSELGKDTAAGTYYKGYCYSSETSGKVTGSGLTVYRYFKPSQYTICFDGNTASEGEMESVTAQYDETVTLPQNLFKKVSSVTLCDTMDEEEETEVLQATHSFQGWATDPQGSILYGNGASVKNLSETGGEVTLYAVWSEETLSLPTLASQIGYAFIGWSQEEEAENGSSQVKVLNSMKMYSVWKKTAVKYHVEYYKENVNGEYELSTNYEFEGYVGDTVSLDDIENLYQGFSVDTAASKLSGEVKADGSLILYAYFRRNTYTLSYDLQDGTVSTDNGVINSQSLKFGKTGKLSVLVPERAGYVFQGWSEEPESSVTLYEAGDSFVMSNHDVVLYAQWKPLSFSVTYDDNASYSKIYDVSGSVEDTTYTCQKDSYASDEVYTSTEGEMVSWNSKKDGSGISVLPGTNMIGLFDDKKSLTLYAIWKLYEDEQPFFKLTIAQEEGENLETLEVLELQGKGGEKISDALLRIYKDDLQGEDALFFYKGYEVVNTEDLEQLISIRSETEVTLIVKERSCGITFVTGDSEIQLEDVTTEYRDEVTLPKTLPSGEEIEQYVDGQGNTYLPGETIVMEHNLELTIQYSIHLYDEGSREKESVEYVSRGSDYTLPERSRIGYQFLGWYTQDGEKIGDAGNVISDVKERHDIYASWSEPLTYQITYDMGGTGVQILENQVSYYQYTKGATLPTASQVAVPEGYQFDGWYYADDAEQTLRTNITATEYGDKILMPKLSVKTAADSAQTSEDAQTQEETKTEDAGTEGEAEAEEETKQETEETVQTAEETTENTEETAETTEETAESTEDQTQVDEKTEDAQAGDDGEDTTKNQDADATDLVKESVDNSDTLDLSQGDQTKTSSESGIKKGTVFWVGKFKYKVISVDGETGSVMLVGNRQTAKTLSIPKKVTYEGISFTVTKIGKKAFYKTTCVKKLVLSDGVTTIGKKAFAGMKNLKKIIIKSKKIKKIGKKAFSQIHKNAVITVPKSSKKAYQKLLKASKLSKSVKIKVIK